MTTADQFAERCSLPSCIALTVNGHRSTHAPLGWLVPVIRDGIRGVQVHELRAGDVVLGFDDRRYASAAEAMRDGFVCELGVITRVEELRGAK